MEQPTIIMLVPAGQCYPIYEYLQSCVQVYCDLVQWQQRAWGQVPDPSLCRSTTWLCRPKQVALPLFCHWFFIIK